VSSLLFIFTLI